MTRFERLSDKRIFPFGIYKGKEFGDVPAEYLDYLHGQDWIEKWPEVLKFIENNRENIDSELEEKGII